MNEQTTTALITRPRLAGQLQREGYKLTPMQSPWEKDRTVWEITLDRVSADIIANYYNRIGKPVPAAVARYLKRGESL